MFDASIRKIIDGPLNRAGSILASKGVSANGVTSAGLALGIVSGLLIAMQNYSAGLFFLLLSRVADGLDGAVARATKKTDFGGYFDIVSDFLFYGIIPLAFAIASPQTNAIAAATLLLSFYVNGATFLGYAILAERKKLATKSQGEKNLYYTDGLLEGTETIAFLVAICVWPNLFALLAYIFAAATFYTAVMRVWRAYKNFGSAPDNS